MDNKKQEWDALEVYDLCEALINLLKDEEGMYLNLVKTEENKKDAILSRDTQSLLKISGDQEKQLQDIDMKEKKRADLVKELSIRFKRKTEVKSMTELVHEAEMSEMIREKLLHHSYALREVMLTLKNISSINQNILEDNNKLFQSLIEELTGRETVGYGMEEKKATSKKSLFVNLNG